MKAEVKLMRGSSIMPEYQTSGAAAFDLHCDTSQKVSVIPSRVCTRVRTGVAVAIPESHVGLLSIRSGLAADHGVMLVNGTGVIDADYRGEIFVCLKGTTAVYDVEPGERIAQLTVVPVARLELEQVEEFTELTERGEGGLGSTGTGVEDEGDPAPNPDPAPAPAPEPKPVATRKKRATKKAGE